MNKTEFHPLDKHIGLRIKQLRAKKGYSLERVAEWLNISKQQVSRLELGKSRMSVVQLYQISRGLDMPISWFLGGFKDDEVEIKWLNNMLSEDRRLWSPENSDDKLQNLISLWRLIESPLIQDQIIGLMESFTKTNAAH